MSYNLIGTFKDENGKVLFVTDLDILKFTNEIKYSISLSNVHPSDDGTYSKESFIDGSMFYRHEYNKVILNLEKLQNIRHSSEYYKLDENGKGNLLEDIRMQNCYIEDFYNKLRACIKVIGMFDMLENQIKSDEEYILHKIKLEIKAE